MPWSKVKDATLLGVGGGIATEVAGPCFVNQAVSMADGVIGYQLYGDPGAIVGSVLSGAAANKLNSVDSTTSIKQISHESGYEEIPSYSSQHVNGYTVTEKRNVKQREPYYKEPQQKKIDK